MFLTTHLDSVIDLGENTNAQEVSEGIPHTLGFVVRDGKARRYVNIAVTPEQLRGLVDAAKAKLEGAE